MPTVIDELLSGQLDLLRLEAGARARVFRLLTEMETELRAKLATGTLTEFGKARIQSFLAQSEKIIQNYYDQISESMDGTLGGAGRAQAAMVSSSLDSVYAVADLGGALPSTAAARAIVSDLLIFGSPSADWWEKQAADTIFRFGSAVRQGLAQGESVDQITRRIVGANGFMSVTRSNAQALVRSSIMEVAAEARLATYRANDNVVEGIRQVSTLDSATTEICIAYDGAEFTLDGEPMEGTDLPYNGGVPRHWGCRSVEIPITKTFKELGLDIPEPTGGERASADGPVPVDTTFDQFLTRMGKDFQDETLGEGRADLWRDGKITLQQLLDLKGNPLTVAELEAKYA